MMEVILNEKTIADGAIKNGKIEDNPYTTINALMKYYYVNGTTKKDDIVDKIMEFLQRNMDDFIPNKWIDKITKSVTTFVNLANKNKNKYKNDLVLIDIKSVNITANELSKIKELNDNKLEKIAFVLLIYAKLSNIINNNKLNYVNKSITAILKEAKVNLKGDDRVKIFHQLYIKNYISQSKKNETNGIIVNYIDDESDVAIQIDDFSSVILYYMLWNGEKVKKCECCGKITKITSNRTKYCPACWKEEHKKQDREYQKKKYDSRLLENPM